MMLEIIDYIKNDLHADTTEEVDFYLEALKLMDVAQDDYEKDPKMVKDFLDDLIEYGTTEDLIAYIDQFMDDEFIQSYGYDTAKAMFEASKYSYPHTPWHTYRSATDENMWILTNF